MITPKLQRDYDERDAYLREHPEAGNYHIWHCRRVLPRTAMYYDYTGKACYIYDIFKRSWRVQKFEANLNPGKLRNSISKVYYSIEYWDKAFKCHKLVSNEIADIFLPNTDFTLNEVDHLDEDIHNNHAENLERVTHDENMRRRYFNYYTRQGREVPERFQTPENHQKYLLTNQSKK